METLPHRLRIVGVALLPLWIAGCFQLFSAASQPPVAPCRVSPSPDESPTVKLEPLIDGLSAPVYLTAAGDGSRRVFIVEQPGTIRVYQQDMLQEQPFLDIRAQVRFGGERGLLSVAFHPQYAENGRFFVNYTRSTDSATVIAEYRVSDDPDLVDSGSERVLLVIEQPFPNHNGGQLQFGPDGMLYVGMGDGGSSGDPLGHGQNPKTLLGTLLRIDVDGGEPYTIPGDNPFVNRPDAQGEIWAYGLRNPWRFSFDRCDGRLFLADVGQNLWEEVDLIEKGGNYGWNVMEGAHCFRPAVGCRTEGLEPPIAEYDHSLGCSITGGYVYRGSRIESLIGRYVFGDFCSGRIWTLTQGESGDWMMQELLDTSLSISSFGEDEQGELYVVDLNGAVYRMANRD
jgi:glucose/arabinose dehydrogenase